MSVKSTMLSERQISYKYSEIAHMISMPKWFYEEIIKQLKVTIPQHYIQRNKISLLDVGCGNGYLLKMIANTFGDFELFDIDISKVLISRAYKLLNGKGSFYAASIYNLPFKNHSFDMVIMTEVIEHLQKPNLGLQEVYRVLKLNGILILTVPNASAFEPFSHIAEHIKIKIIRDRFLPCEHPLKTKQPIDHCYSYNEILKLLRKSNIIRVKGYSYFPYITEEIPFLKTLYRKIFGCSIDNFFSNHSLVRLSYRLVFMLQKP